MRVHQSFLVNYKHIEGLGYDFVVLNNGKEYLSVKIGGRLSVNSTVLWRTLSMLINKWIEAGIDILHVLFTLYIFFRFFGIFLTERKAEFK